MSKAKNATNRQLLKELIEAASLAADYLEQKVRSKEADRQIAFLLKDAVVNIYLGEFSDKKKGN